MDRAIMEHGVLDQAKGDALQAETGMGAARDCDAAAVGDDLHQRLSSHGQLLDAQCITWAEEMPLQKILRKIARRQVSHHKVPIAQFAPPNRLLIGERVALWDRKINGLIPQVRHGIAPSRRSVRNDTDIQLSPPHGRDQLGRTSLAETQTNARHVIPKGTEQLRKKPYGQWPKDANPKMTFIGHNRLYACKRRPDLTRARTGLLKKLLANIRQINAGTVAVKQLGTDFIFDVSDATADRRLLDAEILCSAPEAAALCSR